MWSKGRWRDLSILALFGWAYAKHERAFPEMTMRKFWTAFCPRNLTISAKCVADKKEWKLKHGGRFVDYKDLKDDPPAKKEEKREAYLPVYSANVRHEERGAGARGRREGVQLEVM